MGKIPVIQIPLKGYLKQGDTISKKIITFKHGYEGDLTTATIKMQVYDMSSFNSPRKVIDISDSSGITVINSVSMEIDEVPAEQNDLPADVVLRGDLEVTEADGVKTTYFDVQYNVTRQFTI